jgi:tetratricopeptide (TPR) repeat protein
VPPLQAAAEKPVEKAPEKSVEKSVATRKPTPPPKALSSPLWNEQAKAPAPATVPVTTTAQSNQPQPLPWNAPAAQPAPQPQQAAMPIQPPPVMPPADPSTYGASARPPQPTIATNAIGPARLPANVPSNAVQHWQGPDAVEANAAQQLPTAVLPPATSTPVTQQAQWDEPQYTAPPPQQAAQQPVSPFTPTPYVPQVAKAPEPVQQPAQQPPAYAQAPVQQPQPAAQPAPTTLTPDQMQAADATEPKRILSEASKEIVRNIHPQPKAERGPAKPVFIEHARDLTHLDQQPQPVSAEGQIGHEAMGVKIEIKAPRINFDYELEKAYNALIAGQSNVAIEIYKRVLENDANNKNALFGLATTYHRAGQLDLARPMYSRLLTVDPGNSDGLNNFLVLLSDEAPEEALVELLKLSERNPQYSALPAQIAVIYQKMGLFEKAGQYMFQAIEMAPENITYRYNFAIMLDKQQKFDEAAKLYRQIIQAYQRGEAVPGNIQKIQQRLTFISSNRPS